MQRLIDLAGKVDSITFGDLPGQFAGGDVFSYLKDYFSDPFVQDDMVKMNQDQLYELTENRNMVKMPAYSPKTARHKRRRSLPSDRYTFYETGHFYESLYVYVGDTLVGIMSEGGVSDIGSQGYMDEDIISMFDSYDSSRSALGLNDENFLTLMPEIQGYLVERLKRYLNG